LAGLFARATTPPPAGMAGKALRDLPLFFEPNQGQWNPQVRFSARAGDGRVFLTPRGAVLSVSAPGSETPRVASISMLNANRAPVIGGVDSLPSRSNYFLGSHKENWHTGLSHYGRVRYDGVYPGIDVVYYGNQNQLEYDFILHPGADPGRIRMQFRGAGRLSLTAEGDLALEDGGVRLLQKKPYIYQQDPASPLRRPIGGKYKLLGRNVVAVEVEPYDRSLPLTIDPVVVYASFLGGSLGDAVTAVKVDAAGMLYVYGYTNNSDLTATDGAYKTASAGDRDLFLAKIDLTQSGPASLVYFTYIGGTGADTSTGMALDSAGNVYLTGYTASTDFPTAGSPFQSALAGGAGFDAFVVKLSPSLQGSADLVYSTYLGGTDADQGNAIDVDASGAIYVVGSTRSGDFPLTSSAYAAARWGALDAFIVKLVPGGSPQLAYSSFLGGELNDDGRAIAVAPSGMVYFAGSTSSTTFPLAGNSYRSTLQGGVDIFVAQMDLTKSGLDSLVYTTYFGGSDNEELRGMALDSSGNLLLTGYTLSADFPVTPDAAQSRIGGNADAFVARLDLTAPPDSVVKYATYLGGKGGDVGYAIASDPKGNIYVTGYTLSLDFPVSGDALQKAWGWGADVFIAKLNGSGALEYSTYMGKTGTNIGYAIAAAQDGTIYVGGIAASKGISTTSNAAQNIFGGSTSDGFIVVLAP
jgi:hypothetical protein